MPYTLKNLKKIFTMLSIQGNYFPIFLIYLVHLDPSEELRMLEPVADLITILVCVRIGMRLDTAVSEVTWYTLSIIPLDSCIYVHDRTDYKSGWELEKEWEKEQAEKAKKYSVTTNGPIGGDEDSHESEEDDGLPKNCQVCENQFKAPVKTQCSHFFCEKCIFDHFKSNKKCPVCDRILNGNFNVAREIVEKLKLQESSNKKKDAKIVIGDAKASDKFKKRGEKGDIEGVEFADDDDEDAEETLEPPRPVKQKEVNLEKLAKEFKSSVAQQKEKNSKSEADWSY
jgi:hypothetical protein